MSTHNTLLTYHLPARLRGFSTTRLAPWPLSQDEIQAMGNYAAFNVTHYCGDDPLRVARCRQWLAAQLGINEPQIIVPRQTHSDHVRVITSSDLDSVAGSGLDDVDAVVTTVPGICVGVSTADCVPILLYDRERRVVAAVHAGWRGTAKGIVGRTIEVIGHDTGVSPAELFAVIGPSISATAYEVGEEVASQFATPGAVVRRPEWPRPHLDLWAANCYQLEQAGLPLNHIDIAGICTYAHADTFFSARRLGIQSGRIYTGILIDPA